MNIDRHIIELERIAAEAIPGIVHDERAALWAGSSALRVLKDLLREYETGVISPARAEHIALLNKLLVRHQLL